MIKSYNGTDRHVRPINILYCFTAASAAAESAVPKVETGEEPECDESKEEPANSDATGTSDAGNEEASQENGGGEI